jgi:hypothetical protein
MTATCVSHCYCLDCREEKQICNVCVECDEEFIPTNVFDAVCDDCVCESRSHDSDEDCQYCATIKANPEGEYDPPPVNGKCWKCAEEEESEDETTCCEKCWVVLEGDPDEYLRDDEDWVYCAKCYTFRTGNCATCKLERMEACKC